MWFTPVLLFFFASNVYSQSIVDDCTSLNDDLRWLAKDYTSKIKKSVPEYKLYVAKLRRVTECAKKESSQTLPYESCSSNKFLELISDEVIKDAKILDTDPSRTDFPEILDIPQSLRPFLLKLSMGDVTDKEITEITSEIQKTFPQIKVIQFKGSFPNVDRNFSIGRILVVAPGEKYDQFFQLGHNSHFIDPLEIKNQAPSSNISVISVQKTTKDGRKLDLPVTFFADQKVFYKGLIRTKFDEILILEKESLDCLTCHSNRPIPIISAGFTAISHSEGMSGPDLQKYINSMIGKYGVAKTHGAENIKARIHLGNADPSDEILEKCIPDKLFNEKEVIKKNMNCTSCHNGADQPYLIPRKATAIIEDVIIGSTHMIKYGDLSLPARGALFDCLYVDQADREKKLRHQRLQDEFIQPCLDNAFAPCLFNEEMSPIKPFDGLEEILNFTLEKKELD